MSADNPLTSPTTITSKPRLRVLGTPVTQIEKLREAAQKDLGIQIDYISLDGTEAQRRCALAPNSFDVYDQWFHDLDLVWPTGSLKGIDINRIKTWDEINDLPKTGRLSNKTPRVPGADPSKRLYVQLDGSLGSAPTDQISMLPTVHNVDGFAAIGNSASNLSSWADLLDPAWAGKVILQRDGAIGIIEMVLALIASNQIEVEDPGNLTLEEIDKLTDLMRHYVNAGQFRAIWADEAEAVSAMRSGENTIGSLWWSGAIKLRRFGLPIRVVEPSEGCRGWYGGMALSTYLDGRELDAAHEYLDWWLSGFAGAVMARQGSYISNPSATKKYLSDGEWKFWYGGEPATVPITDIEGQVVYDIGEARSAAYEQRMEKIVIWNAVMEEHNYLVRRWEHALGNL